MILTEADTVHTRDQRQQPVVWLHVAQHYLLTMLAVILATDNVD